MDRKQFLTIFTFIFLTTPLAWSENQVLQDSVDDMSIQKESDQMDVYDQQQIVEQTKKETNELQKQSKQLER
ncbi:hypothetical protein AAEJ42_22275, partial [Shewanella algae]|uniref:hypothetical protein n=1 Tax=Shewanella algae TaxID=38313 RepID=UPI00313E524C